MFKELKNVLKSRNGQQEVEAGQYEWKLRWRKNKWPLVMFTISALYGSELTDWQNKFNEVGYAAIVPFVRLLHNKNNLERKKETMNETHIFIERSKE